MPAGPPGTCRVFKIRPMMGWRLGWEGESGLGI